VDPDLPLIQALQAGDDSALNELMNRHREPLYRFLHRYLRDETATRDVAQETFVRLYFKANQFKPHALVKTWLYTIAVNLARDHLRKTAKRRRDVSLGEIGTSSVDMADTGSVPGDRIVRRESVAKLQQAIDRLPDPLREALVLFAIEGKSQKEAADMLAITPKTVELRVYHAKKKLREWLGLRGE